MSPHDICDEVCDRCRCRVFRGPGLAFPEAWARDRPDGRVLCGCCVATEQLREAIESGALKIVALDQFTIREGAPVTEQLQSFYMTSHLDGVLTRALPGEDGEEEEDMEQVTIGRKVLYVLPNGERRPADVVRTWGADGVVSSVNLMVMLDGSNDADAVKCLGGVIHSDAVKGCSAIPFMLWATSVAQDESGKPGTWHWPPRAGLPKSAPQDAKNTK